MEKTTTDFGCNASIVVEEQMVDDPTLAVDSATNVTLLSENVRNLNPQAFTVASAGRDVKHVTPDEKNLSSISVNIVCPQGCPRTFANSSALRIHLKQVHHKSYIDPVTQNTGTKVWYHCPVSSCLYHVGKNAKHFLKLKYLKQHYLKVHATRSHMCKCGQAYSTAALLAHHQRVCGLNLVCICGRNFTCFETLQTHARRKSHVIHPSTLQALSSRKISLSDPNVSIQCAAAGVAQDMWTSNIPIRHPRLDDGSKNDMSGIGVTVSPSPTSVSRTVPPAICPAPTTMCPTPSTFTQVTSLNLAHPIHLLAAVALGEIAVTAMKRMPCVDVGIQTDGEVLKRSRRKSCSPGRWDPGSSHSKASSKRKRTTETQTRLTHRGNKKKNGGNGRQSSSLIPTKVKTKEAVGSPPTTNTFKAPSFLAVNPNECGSEDKSIESLTLQIDLPDLINSQSSSGTQTSPRAGGLTHPTLHNISISLFDRACGDDEPAIIPPSVTSMTSTQTPHLDEFDSRQLLIEEDDNLLGVVEEASSSLNGHPPLLAHIRSSSIETQTDHDVLLSENAAGTPDDTDEIILTNNETQTDPGNLLNMNGDHPYEPSNPCQSAGTFNVHGSDSVWCTSETQTYEDFSDIEQFMRSTIHTQTPDHAHNELFPELSFTHTQTQTSIDDPPALVTTHTQTPMYTHFPTDFY